MRWARLEPELELELELLARLRALSLMGECEVAGEGVHDSATLELELGLCVGAMAMDGREV